MDRIINMNKREVNSLRRSIEKELGKKISHDETVYCLLMTYIDKFWTNHFTPEVIENIADTMYDAAVFAREEGKEFVNFSDALIDRLEKGPAYPMAWLLTLDEAFVACTKCLTKCGMNPKQQK